MSPMKASTSHSSTVWGSRTCSPSMLECCWLVWFYAGLVQASIAAVSSWQSSDPVLPRRHCFPLLPPDFWTLQSFLLFSMMDPVPREGRDKCPTYDWYSCLYSTASCRDPLMDQHITFGDSQTMALRIELETMSTNWQLFHHHQYHQAKNVAIILEFPSVSLPHAPLCTFECIHFPKLYSHHLTSRTHHLSSVIRW